jgi:hypothetical protein
MYNNNYKSVIITDKPALLRMTTILFLALLAGQIIFGLLVLFVVNNGKMQFSIPPATDVFLIVVPVMAITSVAAGIFIFKLQLKKIAEKESLPDKIQLYLSATIIRFALIEGPSLLAIVCCMLTNNLFYIAISFLLIVYMISLRPTNYRIDNDINLDFDSSIMPVKDNNIF